MKSQLKGNKMRKKNKVNSYKKGGGLGGLASVLSPAYSIMKGKGPASALASQVGKALGPLSPLGMLAKDKREDAKLRRMAMASAKMPTGADSSIAATGANQMQRMMAGGVVKRNRPIDGIASKGMTKGKIT
tara:strand:+ start:1161 stop:1553 length:393 start_codon:yes stop_codon:yes gene_type:complete